jgi:hypothetical protein
MMGLAVLEIGSSIMSFVLCPGPPGAVERPKRSAQQISCVWRFVWARRALNGQKTAVSGPGSQPHEARGLVRGDLHGGARAGGGAARPAARPAGGGALRGARACDFLAAAEPRPWDGRGSQAAAAVVAVADEAMTRLGEVVAASNDAGVAQTCQTSSFQSRSRTW